MTKLKHTILFIGIFIIKQLYGQDLNIKLGDSFSKWKIDFTFNDKNPNSSEEAYVYNKKTQKTVFGREATLFYVTVKNNKIISYMNVLTPSSTDLGVPVEIIKELEKFTGVSFTYKNGEYFAIDKGIGVTVFRENKTLWGGDRIVIVTRLMNN